MRRRGFTLIEVAVATAVLAVAGVALQRLAVRSLGTLDENAARAGWLVVARMRLAEAALSPPPPGIETLPEDAGGRTIRTVRTTAHRALREVHVRSEGPGGRDAAELVELVYVPTD